MRKQVVFGYPVNEEKEVLISDMNKQEIGEYIGEGILLNMITTSDEIVDLVLAWKSLRSFKG